MKLLIFVLCLLSVDMAAAQQCGSRSNPCPVEGTNTVGRRIASGAVNAGAGGFSSVPVNIELPEGLIEDNGGSSQCSESARSAHEAAIERLNNLLAPIIERMDVLRVTLDNLTNEIQNHLAFERLCQNQHPVEQDGGDAYYTCLAISVGEGRNRAELERAWWTAVYEQNALNLEELNLYDQRKAHENELADGCQLTHR